MVVADHNIKTVGSSLVPVHGVDEQPVVVAGDLGVAGAEGRFELDYWGTSIAEATEIMEAKLKAENGGRLGGRYKVFVCANPTSALYFLPPNFVLTEDRREADEEGGPAPATTPES